jgi:MerR family copper efflux transcriptional regulator
MLDAHLDQINHTLTELRHLRRALLAARRTADQTRKAGGDAVVCQIVEAGPDAGK